MSIIKNSAEIAQQKYLQGKTNLVPSVKDEIPLMVEQDLVTTASYTSDLLFTKKGFYIYIFAKTTALPSAYKVLNFATTPTEEELTVELVQTNADSEFVIYKAFVDDVDTQLRIRIKNNSGVTKTFKASVNYKQVNLQNVENWLDGNLVPSVKEDTVLIKELTVASEAVVLSKEIYIHNSVDVIIKTPTTAFPEVVAVVGADRTTISVVKISTSTPNIYKATIVLNQKLAKIEIKNKSGISQTISAEYFYQKTVDLEQPYIFGKAEKEVTTTGNHLFYMSTAPTFTQASNTKLSNFLTGELGRLQNAKFRRFKITIWNTCDEPATINLYPYSRISGNTVSFPEGQFTSTALLYKSVENELVATTGKFIITSLETGENSVGVKTLQCLADMQLDLCVGVEFSVAPTTGKVFVSIEAQK